MELSLEIPINHETPIVTPTSKKRFSYNNYEATFSETRLQASANERMKWVMIASTMHSDMNHHYKVYDWFATICVFACVVVCGMNELDQTRSYRNDFFWSVLFQLHAVVWFNRYIWRQVIKTDQWKRLLREAIRDDIQSFSAYIKCIQILYWGGALVITGAIYAGWDVPILMSLFHPQHESVAGRAFLWIHGTVLTILIVVWVFQFEGIVLMFAIFALASITRLKTLENKTRPTSPQSTARSTPRSASGIHEPSVSEMAKEINEDIRGVCNYLSIPFVLCYLLFTQMMLSGCLNRVWAALDPEADLASVSRWDSDNAAPNDSIFHLIQDNFYIDPSIVMQASMLFFSSLLTKHATAVSEFMSSSERKELESLNLGFYVFNLKLTPLIALIAFVLSIAFVVTTSVTVWALY